MGYISDNLLNGETVAYQAKLHWIIYRDTALFLLLALLLTPVLIQAQDTGKLVLVILFAVVGMFGLAAFIRVKTSEYGITNKRVIMKEGLISRRTVELLLIKTETLSVDQSILGRMLGFGSITLTGTGGTKEVFYNIAVPMRFRNEFQQVASA